MDLSENKGAKLFQDSVHGSMRFDKLLVKIIDTRQMQRLRNIKQLSTTYLVYPAAAHNRFEHCLGVCYLAGKMLDKLKKNTPSHVWMEIFPLDEEYRLAKLAIQIAALLHDLGHGPFSHTWEVFVKACGQQWDHETTSCELIDGMLWQGGSLNNGLTELGKEFQAEFNDVEKYVEFIKNIIKGSVPAEEQKKKYFLYQVVANKFNDIDVDKFDYFLRDAQHLKMGVSFEYRRLLRLSQVQIDSSGTSQIAFRDVERYSIQGMFRNRADLHVRAYQHRVAKCLEAMLIDALKEADTEGYKVGGLRLSRVHENPIHFSKLTDSIQEVILNSDDNYLQGARDILNRMVTRDLYETVGEWTLNNVKQTPEQQQKNLTPQGLSAKKLRELEEQLNGKYALSQVYVNQGKYMDPMKNILFYGKSSGKVTVGATPEIKMDLPFYKLFVFKRVREKCTEDNVTEIVRKFLVKEEVLKSDE